MSGIAGEFRSGVLGISDIGMVQKFGCMANIFGPAIEYTDFLKFDIIITKLRTSFCSRKKAMRTWRGNYSPKAQKEAFLFSSLHQQSNIKNVLKRVCDDDPSTQTALFDALLS